MPLVLRLQQGFPLTYAQLDGNFTYLSQSISQSVSGTIGYIAAFGTPNGVRNSIISQAGSTITITGGLNVSGSLETTGGFTGSLYGTASYALVALNGGGGVGFPYTGSAIISGSLEVTGSITSTQGFTGSLDGTASYATTSSLPLQGLITASVNVSTITFTKGDGSTFDLIVATGSAESAAKVTINNTNTGTWYPSFVVAGQSTQSIYVNSSSFSYNATTNTLNTTASQAITASYSLFAITSSFALTASYVDPRGISLFQITTGSISASVNVLPNNLFLINSGSTEYFNISSSGNVDITSNLFVIKNFTTKQPVLTVTQSLIQIATHSIDPTGTTLAGSIWFTSASMYVGLE